jgi:tRNA (guanosine-2'-O-)-methyltransferase
MEGLDKIEYNHSIMKVDLRFVNEERKNKIETVLKNRSENIVVLEDIHDPHNAAAVWRSCDAFGIGKVYLIFDQEEVFNPKKVGKTSSSSANKWLDFEVFSSTKECMDKLHRDGYKIYGTVLDRESNNLQSTIFDLHKKIAVMFGNEHRGLSETAIKMCDEKIYIPMKGMVQSLNLSVTAGIVLWEMARQTHP